MQGGADIPPQSTSVSSPSFFPSLAVAAAHLPRMHVFDPPQSASDLHVAGDAHPVGSHMGI
jgi:hypothetical protein